MTSNPTGTVTFLFTDIENSTKLARENPETWEAARARHHAILREAIDSNHGYVFQIIGDAFCAAFHKAGDALKAAIKAQQDLQDEAWGEFAIYVRMGIHTGEAELAGDEYRGYSTLSFVQRLMSAGHGGQILVSNTTENLLRGKLPKEINLREMGKHHFRDVPQPVRIFQVIAPELPTEFPPLRTVSNLPNNLPTQLTSFVGRDKELADVKKLLQNARMLTLIGPGGTGKTRLSIRAANEMLDQYPDGAWFVELAPILDPLLVPRTTAIAIGLRDEPQRPVIDMLCDYLHEKKILLILDNCEHLVEACARMADRILHSAPGTCILASSRESLGIGGEVTYRVPSLGLPDMQNLPSIETLSQYEAVKLFIDRAMSAVPTFIVTNDNAPALAQVCHHLDGIPLAIELAAAKIRVLSVEQIAKRLDDRFRLLTGGSRTVLERHQTLRAAIDWSYNLLPPTEQMLFRRLSVFIGGWTLEAAELVCSDETVKRDDVLELLEHLIQKSLVFREEERGQSRYHMLETIRQYANERLVESGDSDTLRDRHLEYFLNHAETVDPHLIRPEQLEWLPLLDAEYENLSLALEWALNKEVPEFSLRLCAALGTFWILRGRWKEGTKALSQALAKPITEENYRERADRVRALNRDSQLAETLDDLERMEHSARISLALAAQGSDELDTAIAEYLVGLSLYRLGSFREALPFLEKSLKEFETLGQPYWQANAFHCLGYIRFGQGEMNQAEVFSRVVELARKSGERMTMADSLLNQAFYYYIHMQLQQANGVLEQADDLYQSIGFVMNPTNNQRARIAWVSGDIRRATSLLLLEQEHYRLLGAKSNRANMIYLLGCLAMEERDLDQAEVWLEQSLTISQETRDGLDIPFCLVQLGILADIKGDSKKFKGMLRESHFYARNTSQLAKANLLMNMISSPFFQKPEHSTQLLGALDAFYKQRERPKEPLQKRYYDSAEARARAVLGDTVFERTFAKGADLSIDQAFDLALQTVEELE
jgi:predicted ATPase/class 3 adenylate cyclase